MVGCVQQPALIQEESLKGNDEPAAPNDSGALYQPFAIGAFEQAKSEGKVIFLEFYANWCPICKRQKPALEQAFRELSSPNIVGFEVNYNDSETDEDEKTLARKFGVAYQHTHVIIDSSENVLLKELTEWSKEETISKLELTSQGRGINS